MSTPVTEIPTEALNIASRVAGFTDGYCYVFDLLRLAVNDPETPPEIRTFVAILMQTRRDQNSVIGRYFQRIVAEQASQHVIN